MGAEKVIPLIGILGVAGLATHYYNNLSVEQNITPLSNTSFAQKTPEELTEIELIKEQAVAEYIINDADPVDTWSEYLPNIYGGSYFKNFINDEEDADNPFMENGRIVVGGHSWPSTSKLKLIDYDSPRKTSGGCKLKVRAGYEVLLTITTENSEYFANDVSEEGESTASLTGYADSISQYAKEGSIWKSTNSAVTVPLIGDKGDYLSVDIDSDHSGIRAFRVVSDGRRFSDNGGYLNRPNDEVYIKLEQVNRRNDNYDASKFSAESITYNSIASVGKLSKFGKLWNGITTIMSAVNPLKRFGKLGQGGAQIAETTYRVGDKVGDTGKVAEAGYKLTDGMVSNPKNLTYIKSFNKTKKTVKLDDGVVLVREGKVVGEMAGRTYKLKSGDELIKITDTVGDAARGGKGLITLRNSSKVVLGSATAGVVYVIGATSLMLPNLFGDAAEEWSCSVTGSCCDEKCEDSDNPDCVAECQDAADEKGLKFGGLAIAGVVGLVLVLKMGKSKKAAEEYYMIKQG